MKLQKLLPLFFPSLVVASDDTEQLSSSLRGTVIRDSASSLGLQNGDDGKADFDASVFDVQRNRQAQFMIPTRPPRPEEVPSEKQLPDGIPTESPVDIATESPIATVVDPTESPIATTADPTQSPTPNPTNSPTAPPTTQPPVPFIIPRPPGPRPVLNFDPPTAAPVFINRPTVGLGPTSPPTFPIPPILQQTVDVNGNMCGMSTPGTVILHGGIFNYEDPLSDTLGQTIVREMRTNSNNRIMDPLVFVPGARVDVTLEDEATFENQWRDVMAPGVQFTVLHADDQEPEFTNVADAAQADTEAFVRPLKTAGGVFLPGGRQWRFIDAYKYTQTEEELWNVLKRGGVIAGTSAGAAVMASFMPRGDPLGSARFIAEREWYQHGFGFVSNIAVDNHVSARGRENAMYELFNTRLSHRKLLGIGLNENTMVTIKGRYAQVRGDRGFDSVARFYDCSKIRDTESCSSNNAPYAELRQGNWYDLCARQQMFAPPSFNDLDEDLGIRSVLGAYRTPWRFQNDFKAGNPTKFLCSRRRCNFQSSPIVIDKTVARISGRVFARGNAFSNTDRLRVRFRVNDDPVWQTVFDTLYSPQTSSWFGQSIFSSIALPNGNGKKVVHVEIEGESSAAGDAEFEIQNLMLQ